MVKRIQGFVIDNQEYFFVSTRQKNCLAQIPIDIHDGEINCPFLVTSLYLSPLNPYLLILIFLRAFFFNLR